MSGLLSLLANSGQSLQAQQAYSQVVGQNLSNANTPGYTRQTANLAAITPSDLIGNSYIGRGAMLQSVTQSRDRFIEAQMPRALGNNQASSTESSVLQAVDALDPGTGLTSAMGSFFSSLRALAQNPGNASLREAASGATRQLALSFNQTGSAFASARTGVDSQISSALPDINQTAKGIADLNVQIRQASASGAQPNDLIDARRKLADHLSETTGATIVGNDSTDVNMQMPDGTALVTANAATTLSAVSDATNAGHLKLQATMSDGSVRNILTGPGGKLGGLIAARDGALKTAETRVDTLAFDLATALNTQASAGYALDGTTGHAMFTVSATATGAASAIATDPTLAGNASLLPASSSAASVPGDATNLQAMIAIESQALSGGTNASATLTSITTGFGSAAETAAASATGDGAVLSNLSTLRDSTSGVSFDEELVNMQQAQRGYQAVAKVIETTNTLLDTLMSIK
jgi:flagellar hook-associated protein 1 FlgK